MENIAQDKPSQAKPTHFIQNTIVQLYIRERERERRIQVSMIPQNSSKHEWHDYISMEGQNPTNRSAKHDLHINSKGMINKSSKLKI